MSINKVEVKIVRRLLGAACVLIVSSVAVDADEFTDVVNSAMELYNEGDISGAREELDYAVKLLAEIKSDSLSNFLPDALPGWEKEAAQADGTGMAMAMFGGGTAAAASYRSDDSELTITLVANSPMISSIGAMVSGMSALTGGKPIRIQRTQFGNNDGELQGVVDNRILVSVNGSASLEDKQAYLEAMDFGALKDF